MDEQCKDHQVRGPAVKRSDKPAKMHFGHDEAHALEGGFCRRPVIQKEQNSGDHLDRKQEQRHPAEVVPDGVPMNRNGFLAKPTPQSLAADAVVQPGFVC